MPKPAKTGVRKAYTTDHLKADILRQRSALDAKGKKPSYRAIAKRYGVSHAVIHRLMVYNIEPKDHQIRHALGLTDYVLVEACAKCGKAHDPVRRCPGEPTKYAAHPVMRLSKIRRILQSPYKDS